jgi:uncharacterized 2Fe-2S/4Fe-4S cluster protein (DUF4445 family)
VRLLSGQAESEEGRHITADEYAAGWRLACATKPRSSLTVSTPESAFAWRSRIRVTDFSGGQGTGGFDGLAALAFSDNGLEAVTVHLAPPTLEDALADRERLLNALAGLAGGTSGRDVGMTLYALRKLPHTLRASDFAVTCVVRKGAEAEPDTVLDLFPAAPSPVLPGLAIDIGTTTVSLLLVDLASGALLAAANGGNAQIRYGADVINRIIESTRPGGLERLRGAIADECLSPLIARLCRSAGIAPERIYRVALAGNTTMTELLLGAPPEFLRLEPYVPAFFQADRIRGAELRLGVHPDAEVAIAPAIGSYVGGDITAGVFASGIGDREALSLFIDLGTNGELVLGNRDFLMSCACSAGPAFEGGDISCGMRATDGAIESCGIDRETMTASLTVIGGPDGAARKPAGLCGSGLIDTISELFRCRIINARGKYIRDGDRILRDRWGGAGYVVAAAAETDDGRALVLTESDIDNFIRAKAAIFSAIRTMLAVLDLPPQAITEALIAGGIGSGLNIARAVSIGMLPNLPLARYRYIGNAALSGAYAMLRSREAVRKVGRIRDGMTYIELSSHPGYMNEFVAACFLPHTDSTLFEPPEAGGMRA